MAAQLLALARQECAGVQTTADPIQLAKVLAEIGKADLGVQLAIAHDLSPAYPIAVHLQSIRNSNEHVGDPEMDDFRKQQINEYIAQVLSIVPAKYMSALAQYLIVC